MLCNNWRLEGKLEIPAIITAGSFHGNDPQMIQQYEVFFSAQGSSNDFVSFVSFV